MDIREIVQKLKEDDNYKQFFKKALDTFKVSSIKQLDQTKKKQFLDYLDKNYIEEAAPGVASKGLQKATNDLHAALFAQQELVKKFQGIPKDKVALRDQMKKQLVAAKQNVDRAQSIFDRAIGDEDTDDVDINDV